MKKLLLTLFAAVALFAVFAAVGCGNGKQPEGENGEQGELVYTLSGDGKSYSVGADGGFTVKQVEIPTTYENLPVTAIAESAFKDCTQIQSVVIPQGVTSIGKQAFYGCTGLLSVTIPEGMLTIDSMAFYDCSSLSAIKLPEGLTEIGTYAFKGCSKLKTVAIPEGVEMVQVHSFENCTALKSVIFPSTVTSVKDTAFSGCTSLESVAFPEGAEKIGQSTFLNCSSLTSILIPESVISIGSQALASCGSLSDIYYEGTQSRWEQIEKPEGWDAESGEYTVHFSANKEITYTAGGWNYLTYYYTDGTGKRTPMEFAVYVPEGYGDISEALPLITYIPDARYVGSKLSDITIGGEATTAWLTEEKSEKEPVMWLVPLITDNNSLDASAEGSQASQVVPIVDLLVENFNVDENRLYLTGHSMGGIVFFSLNDVYPEKFAATVYVACQPGGKLYDNMYNTIMENAEFLNQKFVYIASRKDGNADVTQDEITDMLDNLGIAYGKLYGFLSSDDDLEERVAEVLAQGYDLNFLGFETCGGTEHVDSFAPSYAIDAVYDWLLLQTLE